MRQIPLTQGKFALVDNDDYESLMQWKWHYNGRCAARGARRHEGKFRIILMHRVIMNTPDGLDVDHINGNPLDNRKSNLRNCLHAENARNVSKQRSKYSKFKGVCWDKRRNLWYASIHLNNKKMHIGYFKEEEEAARAYDKTAVYMHGEFARLNFPNDDPGKYKPRQYHKKTSSRYRGVSWWRAANKWRADIKHQKKQIYLGTFDSEIEAALAYNKAARMYHSELACLNKVEIRRAS